MTEVHIITPPGMFGASADEGLLTTAMRVIGAGFGDPEEWAAKYGTDFENDVFLMKRYCWCEKEGECPWCTGCGIYQDDCAACKVRHAHLADCYQQELERRQKAAGLSYIDHEKHEYIHVDNNDYKAECRKREKIYKELCNERGLDPLHGAAMHCDCGTEARAAPLFEAGQGCHYHHGTGIFERFAPWTLDRDRHYYDPPNFWFKPADFRLTWYKYIGRDMASNKDELPGDFMESIFATHPRGMTVKDAVDETARREEESSKAFREMFAKLRGSSTPSPSHSPAGTS